MIDFKRVLSAAIALLGTAVLPGGADETSPVPALFDNWQVEQGLPQNTISAIARGPRGYLWIGTHKGLVRFDGTRFTVFDRENTPALGSDFIRELKADAEGSLWIATRQGLNRWQDGALTLYTPDDGLLHAAIQALFVEEKGPLWIGTLEGLSRFDGGGFTNFRRHDGLIHDSVWVLEGDGSGRLWIGTQDGLSLFQNGRFTNYTTADGLPDNQIYGLHVDRRQRVWVSTATQLGLFTDGRFVVQSTGAVPNPGPVWAFLEDDRGTLWVGAEHGLLRLAQGIWSHHGPPEGRSGSRVRAFWQGNAEGLWIGTHQEGLYQRRERKVSYFGTGEWWSRVTAWTVREGRRGHVWIGTDEGLTQIAPDGEIRTFTSRDGLPSSIVRTVFEDRRGTLWIGTALGLAWMRDGQIRPYLTAEGQIHPRVKCFAEDRDGHLWVGTHGFGLHRHAEDEMTVYTTDDGLPDDIVRDLHVDAAGALWIATNDGLSRFEDDGIKAYTSRDGIPRGEINSLYGDAAGDLWIGTAQGLVRWRDGSFTHFSEGSGFFTESLFTVLEDEYGRLWFSSRSGILSVDKEELNAFADGRESEVAYLVYDEYDGMRSREGSSGSQPAGWRSRSGKLWFPTLKGVAIVEPKPVAAREQPVVWIEEVVIAGRSLASGQRAVLPPGTRSFEFRYAAPAFLAPRKTRFRYKLEGLDEDWVEAGDRRQASYPHLPAGEYRFRVIARHHGGAWSSEGDVFELYLKPHFYETWYFYLACALGLGLAARGIHHYSVRRLVRHNEELRRMQKELETKNAELERFTYTVSHDLKSPLYTIQGFIGFLEKDALAGDQQRVASDVSQIRGAADKMRQLLDELLELSRIGRMVNAPEEVSLVELAREAVEIVARRIDDCGAEVVVADDLPVVTGDRRRLLEVFQNLIDNAVKFTCTQSRPRIEIGVRDGDGEDVLYVRDNGIGIAPRYHDKVFGLFERLNPQDEGTGIGLALVKRIVEFHGGRIWVESEGEGRGSVFYFTLPGA